MIVEILLVLAVIAICVLGFFVYRLTTRLLQFDELFGYLVDDLDTNVGYFEKLTKTDLFENSPEIQKAHQNMKIISVRLEEFISRMQELTGREARTKSNRERNKNPPVVI